MASMGPNTPWPWDQRPYLSPVGTEGVCRWPGLEGEGRGGGGGAAPWRPQEWDGRGGPQNPPSQEEKDPYGVPNLESRGRPWLPPEKYVELANWGPTGGGPQGPLWGSSELEGQRGSWEPLQERAASPPKGGWLRVPLSPPREDSSEPPPKRVKSPPKGEWLRVPLSPPRGRDWASLECWSPSSRATPWEPTPSGSRRDSPGNVGSPWVPQGRWEAPATESLGRSRESPLPSQTWESHRDPERRDSDWSNWPEEPGGRGSHSRQRGDPVWEAQQGNVENRSSPVTAGGSGENWSRGESQGFQSQVGQKKRRIRRGNRGRKGRQDEGPKNPPVPQQDPGRSAGSPEESIPPNGRRAKKNLEGNFLGPKSRPRRNRAPRKKTAPLKTWFPRVEVVEYWTRYPHVVKKQARDKFLAACPRPSIPDGSSEPPALNPELKLLFETHAGILSAAAARFSLITRDVLDMLGPAMAVYEITEAAIERQEEVDPVAVRKLARSLLSYARSANRRLMLQRRSQVIRAIDPRLPAVMPRMSVQNSGLLLFAENEASVVERFIRSIPTLPEKPPGMDFGHRQEAERAMVTASPLELAAPFQDVEVSLSDPRAELQAEASLELWHRRFGHVNSTAIFRLQKGKLATGINVDPGEADSIPRCVTCLSELGHKPSFSLNAVKSSTALMDLVQCELSGPFKVPSLMLSRYVLIFVDDFSRYSFTYLMREAREAHTCFKKYLGVLSQKHQWKPKAFQMNSAAGCISRKTQSFLERQGIEHRRGVERVSGQSRTAEREMKSLLEMTRCMLADADLPDQFWGHAILTATYLLNRLSVSRKKKTPFQVWHGRAPDVKHLRVFGSLARDKREPNDPARHVFVGYRLYRAGYLVMNLETGVVDTKCALDFDEGQGGEKRGKYFDTVGRHGCALEPLNSQPELNETPASGGTRDHTPGDGNGDEIFGEIIETLMPQCAPASAIGRPSVLMNAHAPWLDVQETPGDEARHFPRLPPSRHFEGAR